MPFSMIMLLDHIKRKSIPPELRVRMVRRPLSPHFLRRPQQLGPSSSPSRLRSFLPFTPSLPDIQLLGFPQLWASRISSAPLLCPCFLPPRLLYLASAPPAPNCLQGLQPCVSPQPPPSLCASPRSNCVLRPPLPLLDPLLCYVLRSSQPMDSSPAATGTPQISSSSSSGSMSTSATTASTPSQRSPLPPPTAQIAL